MLLSEDLNINPDTYPTGTAMDVFIKDLDTSLLDQRLTPIDSINNSNGGFVYDSEGLKFTTNAEGTVLTPSNPTLEVLARKLGVDDFVEAVLDTSVLNRYLRNYCTILSSPDNNDDDNHLGLLCTYARDIIEGVKDPYSGCILLKSIRSGNTQVSIYEGYGITVVVKSSPKKLEGSGGGRRYNHTIMLLAFNGAGDLELVLLDSKHKKNHAAVTTHIIHT